MSCSKYETEKIIDRKRKLVLAIKAKRPRNKFKFRKEELSETEAAARDAAAAAKAAAKAAEAISVTKEEDVVENKGILISNETGSTKTIENKDGKDVELLNMTDCALTIECAGSLFVREMRNCLVHVTGKIGSSCLLHDSEDCIFIFSSLQQLRIHTSTKLAFYVHITSGPIIEDCHKIYFAPVSVYVI